MAFTVETPTATVEQVLEKAKALARQRGYQSFLVSLYDGDDVVTCASETELRQAVNRANEAGLTLDEMDINVVPYGKAGR